EVKRRSADGSVGITHVRVGCRQTFKYREPSSNAGLFCFSVFYFSDLPALICNYFSLYLKEGK
ncbi:hypothetical protein, partial [Gilliamella sp. BG7]|uniref:hypothetical protein n=1 Tax=unclassified Gilliamella TaxID=2685620 RepID=UPI003988673A